MKISNTCKRSIVHSKWSIVFDISQTQPRRMVHRVRYFSNTTSQNGPSCSILLKHNLAEWSIVFGTSQTQPRGMVHRVRYFSNTTSRNVKGAELQNEIKKNEMLKLLQILREINSSKLYGSTVWKPVDWKSCKMYKSWHTGYTSTQLKWSIHHQHLDVYCTGKWTYYSF